MYLRTAHGTIVVADRDDGRLRHLPTPQTSDHRIVDIGELLSLDGDTITDGSLMRSGPLSDYRIYRSKAQNGFHFLNNGHFLCAELRSDVLVCDRLTPGPWELFTPAEKNDVTAAFVWPEELSSSPARAPTRLSDLGATCRSDQPELMKINRQTHLFEILTARLYELVCKSGDICVDAGANFGDHTFGMARAVGPSGIVHAIEPLPYLAERLVAIARQIGLPIEVHKLAVSDRRGIARFQHVKNIPGASGLWHRPHPEQPVETETIDVEMNRIDIFLEGKLSGWRFLKADIECGEYHALLGARELIKRYRPFIAFENGWGRSAEVVGYTKEEWFGLFKMLNYRPYDLYGFEITADRWPDSEQPYMSIAVAIGSSDEAFLQGTWRDEVDRVNSEVLRGLRSWPPPPIG
jgi:FkbM family methyltransferase